MNVLLSAAVIVILNGDSVPSSEPPVGDRVTREADEASRLAKQEAAEFALQLSGDHGRTLTLRPDWRCAFARFSSVALDVSTDGRSVWSVPALTHAEVRDPDEPYFSLRPLATESRPSPRR